MNITFYSNVTTKEKAFGYITELNNHKVEFVKLDEIDRLKALTDTEILIVDAMGNADESIISSMPNLKLIMSEGVGYQGIDIECAKRLGIPVCNNKGVNDTAVAEDTVLLILGCLKSIITGNQAVYDGKQIDIKKASFGIVRELGECTVGLLGFGDIARMTARYLTSLGARVIYTNRTRYDKLEKEYNVEYVDLDTLLDVSDFVSLHLAVTDETKNIVNDEFLAKMKNDAYLINTARGDLVDNNALLNALLNGTIAGAGLDVIAPEPVTSDNILLDNRIRDKLLLTPHIAGITRLTVKKIYQSIWHNIECIINNQPLKNTVY